MEKKLVDVTDKILESSVVTGKLKSFEYMMKSNKQSYIQEGRRGNEKRTAKANKTHKERNNDAKRPD